MVALSAGVVAALSFFACSPALIADAARVSFGLVAFPKQRAQVAIGGRPPVDLGHPDPNEPYYMSAFDVPEGTTYKYVVDGAAEAFQRTVTREHVRNGRTHNDFFGRQVTVQKLPNLPHPFNDQWKRGLGVTPMFDDSYVPTIHLSGDRASIQNMWTKMVNVSAAVRMTVITADYVVTHENVEYGISAAGRKMNYAKQAYRLKLPTGAHLFGRDEWKLRNIEEDPLQLREKTYMNMLNAAGVPTLQANLIRLYVNKEPVGTYAINDDGDQKSFIKAVFHGPATPLARNGPIGTLIQGNFIDFVYKGDDPALYTGADVTQPGQNPLSNPRQSLIALLKYINAIGTDDAAIDALNKKFDVESFLRAMAFEFLTLHWDGYWEMGTNFLLYEDPLTTKWFFIDQDFDQTMGCGATSTGYSLANATTLTVAQYGGNAKGQRRPVLEKILAAPKYKARFDAILKAIVQHLFNPAVLGARLRVDAARVKEEVLWDRGLTRRHTGRPDNWKAADFDTNMLNGVHVPLASCEFGFYQWIELKSAAVAGQLGVVRDTTPLPAPDPVTAAPGNLPRGSLNDIVAAVRANSAGATTSPLALLGLTAVGLAVTVIAL